MSTTQPPPFQPEGPGAYSTGGNPQTPQQAAPTPAGKQKHTLAIVAFVVAVVGFIFAVMEGAYILGWVLLPIAFILSLVALFAKDKPKKLAVAALLVSIVGTVAGFVAFMGSVGRIVEEELGGGTTVASQPAAVDSEVSEPADEPGEDPAAEESEPAAAEEAPAPGPGWLGTRSEPLPLGSVVSNNGWDIVVNSFTADATDAVLAEFSYNDPPADGHTYALANVTITRTAEDSDTTLGISVDYITESGNVLDRTDTIGVIGPDSLGYEELFGGASVTGNVLFEIAEGDAGVLRVTPGLFDDPAFVAIS